MAASPPSPRRHADLAAPATLAASDEQRATALIEIALGKGERFLDAQASSPQNHDQPAQAAAMRVVAGRSHDSNEPLHLGRIGRITQTLVVGRSTGVEAWHGRRRSTSSSAVNQQLGHVSSSARRRAEDQVSRVRRRAPSTLPILAVPHP
jgi:hypothetical protein